MKYLKWHILSASLFLVVLVYGVVYTQQTTSEEDAQKEKLSMELIKQALLGNHFSTIDINDEVSKDAFKNYLNTLDPYKKFLIQEDVEKLKTYEFKIDEAIKLNDLTFFNYSLEVITKRTEESYQFIDELLSKPFNFNKLDSIILNADSVDYAKNSSELRERWRDALKYQVLNELYLTYTRQQELLEKKDSVFTPKSIAELEIEAREKVKKSNEQWFKMIRQIDRTERYGAYVNAFLHVIDPHTDFFPPKEKEDFDIDITGKLEGIGATLKTKDGYISVVDIVVGSASWRQGELKEGDIILKVAQGDAEPVDVVDMRLDKAVQLIRGKKGTEVRLTIKKLDGSIVVISIIRDIVVLEETYAKSSIVYDKDSTYKIGYIYLPKFYVDFTDNSERNCADDIKKELLKLKKEQVDGIVFDLRYNGGGSLQKVVDIGGFFIPKGPIVQVKAKYGLINVLNDEDPEVQYDGPLVVMVNSFSASASEILAAALQDYGCAIIVGTASTFGKGTVQNYLDFDRSYKLPSNLGSFGAMKVTTQKFYRINGGSTQWKGVIPDIVFPDLYSYIDLGEKELEHSIPWDEIKPLVYERKTISKLNDVVNRSMGRIKQDTNFVKIDEQAKQLKKQQSQLYYTLHFDSYLKEQQRLKQENEEYTKIQQVKTGLKVHALKEDMSAFKGDTLKIERHKKFTDKLSNDIYLRESIQVLEEMIKK